VRWGKPIYEKYGEKHRKGKNAELLDAGDMGRGGGGTSSDGERRHGRLVSAMANPFWGTQGVLGPTSQGCG